MAKFLEIDGAFPPKALEKSESGSPLIPATPASEEKEVVVPGCKIIDKMNKAVEEKRPFYSFEFFPPKTAAGVHNLYARLDRMASLEPMFIDVTWGAGGSTAALTLELSSRAQQLCSAEVMMHLTCTNMSKEKLKLALEATKKAGIRNILALRGDPPRGVEIWEQCEGGFAHAVELVKFIRQEYGDYFGIAVAGYPEGHLEAKGLDQDIKHLKEKVDAGADFVVTQLFYDVDLFLKYQKKCREAGINVPIIPGIMPIQNYNGFRRMTGFCKTHIPEEILENLEPMKHDDDRVKAYGIELGRKMCQRLLDNGVPGLHFYTLNLERSVVKILEKLGFVTSPRQGGLPWKQSQISRRKAEDVRPIFWANRPQSYLDRTSFWDEFPNGRWGDAASPAFGDLSDHHLQGFRTGTPEQRRRVWGKAPTVPKDIFAVFEGYVLGKVPRLPWCETPLHLETIPLRDRLARLNKNGILTINSQPAVNGKPSTDPAVGWGGPGGYVYQKAYLEFFCSPANLEKFCTAMLENKSLSYTAVNAKGQTETNKKFGATAVNAVTWGVFPDKEIIQPTVVDSNVFTKHWKDEAFALWTSQWQSIYDKNSASWQLIQTIHDSYFLVNVVDNDYIGGDLFAVIDSIFS